VPKKEILPLLPPVEEEVLMTKSGNSSAPTTHPPQEPVVSSEESSVSSEESPLVSKVSLVPEVSLVKEPTLSTGTSLSKLTEELQATRAVDKKQFFKFLGLSMDKYDLELTQDVAERYRNHIISLKTGLHAVVPLICAGPRCPINDRCPLVVRDPKTGIADHNKTNYPLMKACPVEREILMTHIMDLCEEYGIGPSDITDLAIVTKIATLDIYDYRATILLSKEEFGSVVIEEEIGANPRTGDVFTSSRIHPAFELKERIHKMRQDLLKSMVGTRREKVNAQAKLKQMEPTTDVTKALSQLHEKLKALEAEEEEAGFIDVDFEELDD